MTNDVTHSAGEMLLETLLGEHTSEVMDAVWRSGESAWSAARAGLDQAWGSAVAALAELAGGHDAAAQAPASRSRAFIDDAELKVRVVRALHADGFLRAARLDVESVYDGLVVLGGRAPGLATHRRAFEVAATVPGVRRVMSIADIDSPAEVPAAAPSEFRDLAPDRAAG